MPEKPEEKKIPDNEIDELKEEIQDLKKKKEIEKLKAEVDSLKNQNKTEKKKKEIKTLQAEVDSLTPEPYQNSAPNSSQYLDPKWDEIKSKRTTAGILGILFGSFGVHKFILGYTGEGFIYLGVTVFGGVITCGLAWGVTYILGIVEGIIYLTKTPEEFKRIYIDKKTGWF
tara:strand:+ start:704 stop:1216 length:513 start_codon:yes stop_codon:yes gene_type:complete